MDTGFSIIYKDLEKAIKAIIHKPFGFGPRYDSSIINSKPRFSPWNMVGEVVLEEVPRLLSSDSEHCHQVCRIHSVPQKLEAHAWRSYHCSCVWLQGMGKPA